MNLQEDTYRDGTHASQGDGQCVVWTSFSILKQLFSLFSQVKIGGRGGGGGGESA